MVGMSVRHDTDLADTYEYLIQQMDDPRYCFLLDSIVYTLAVLYFPCNSIIFFHFKNRRKKARVSYPGNDRHIVWALKRSLNNAMPIQIARVQFNDV